MSIRIKDWRKFQHFKDRRPPWIKLYRDILDDPEWHELDPVSAKNLVMLWLIASEYEGSLPCVKKLAFRLRVTEKQVESICSKITHWTEQDDITPISGRYQDDAPEERRVEKRREEKEGEKKAETPEKITFLEYVKLTADQHATLLTKLGEELTASYIARLNNYIGSKGKKYQSHYHTILSWVAKDGPIQKPQEQAKSRNLCVEDGCDKIGIIGQGGRMYCRKHNPEAIAV